MARLPNFLVIIRSEKLSGKGQGRGAKKRTFRFGKKNVSFPKVETFRFADYTGETIIGANVFRDFFASIRDVVGGRSGSYEEVLREAKDIALREMQEHARALGANAVIGVDLDYETVGGSGSMLMVTACGTAVTVE